MCVHVPFSCVMLDRPPGRALRADTRFFCVIPGYYVTLVQLLFFLDAAWWAWAVYSYVI